RETLEPKLTPMVPEHLKGRGAEIWTAWRQSYSAEAFATALSEHNIQLAAATKEEADQSYRLAAFAREVGNWSPIYSPKEVVAVTENGQVFTLNERTTGEHRGAVERFLTNLDRSQLLGIEATKQMLLERTELREIERQAFRDLSAVGVLEEGITTREMGQGALNVLRGANSAIGATVRTIGHGAALAAGAAELVANVAGETIEMLGDMIGATEMTPERIQAAIDAREQAAAQHELDVIRSRADADYGLQREAREREKLDEERQRRYYEQQERERER